MAVAESGPVTAARRSSSRLPSPLERAATYSRRQAQSPPGGR